MFRSLVLAALLLPLPLAGAAPIGTCTATSFLVVTLPAPVTIPGSAWGARDVTTDTLYIEDRGAPPIVDPPPPLVIPPNGFVSGVISFGRPGFAFGSGTWVYAESNGIAGLQRGGGSLFNPLHVPIYSPDNEFLSCGTTDPDTLLY